MKNQDKLRDAIEEILLDSIIDSNRVEKFPYGKAASQILSLFEKEINEREKELYDKFVQVIGEDKPTNTGLPMIDEPNIYQNLLKKGQRQKLNALRLKGLNLLGREETK